ncbi:MAG: addiction module protein [Planctomycetaceae bacterium]
MPTIISDYTKLSISERIALFGEIRDNIVAEGQPIGLTDQQRAELRRRREAHRSNPDDAVPWEKIRHTDRRA